jgi:hypothetical protein
VYGALPLQDKLKEYHTEREIYYPTIDFLVEFPVHYGLIDAYWSADGPFGIFADREPNLTQTVIGGENLLAVDWVGASKMGLNPLVSRYMQLAVQAFGRPEVQVIGDASPYRPWENVHKELTDVVDTVEETYGFFNVLFAIPSSPFVDKIFTRKPQTRLMKLLRPLGAIIGLFSPFKRPNLTPRSRPKYRAPQFHPRPDPPSRGEESQTAHVVGIPPLFMSQPARGSPSSSASPAWRGRSVFRCVGSLRWVRSRDGC